MLVDFKIDIFYPLKLNFTTGPSGGGSLKDGYGHCNYSDHRRLDHRRLDHHHRRRGSVPLEARSNQDGNQDGYTDHRRQEGPDGRGRADRVLR